MSRIEVVGDLCNEKGCPFGKWNNSGQLAIAIRWGLFSSRKESLETALHITARSRQIDGAPMADWHERMELAESYSSCLQQWRCFARKLGLRFYLMKDFPQGLPVISRYFNFSYNSEAFSSSIEEEEEQIEFIPWSPRERDILRYWFGLGDVTRQHTGREIGMIFKLSNERVRQIKDKALRKWKSRMLLCNAEILSARELREDPSPLAPYLSSSGKTI